MVKSLDRIGMDPTFLLMGKTWEKISIRARHPGMLNSVNICTIFKPALSNLSLFKRKDSFSPLGTEYPQPGLAHPWGSLTGRKGWWLRVQCLHSSCVFIKSKKDVLWKAVLSINTLTLTLQYIHFLWAPFLFLHAGWGQIPHMRNLYTCHKIKYHQHFLLQKRHIIWKLYTSHS